MGIHVDVVLIRLFIRFLLGFILLSTAISKFIHPKRFRRGIEDYQLIPTTLETKFNVSTLLSLLIPFAEIISSAGLMLGFPLIPIIFLTLFLLVFFSTTIAINLIRGRSDLSCHCSGTLGNHSISWWLIVRNALLMSGPVFILLTPPDLFTISTVISNPKTSTVAMLLNTVLPVLLLAVGLLVILTLINATRTVLRPQ